MVLNRALMGVLRGRGTCQRPDLKLQTLKASCDVAHAITHMPCMLITTQMETYEHYALYEHCTSYTPLPYVAPKPPSPLIKLY